MNFEWSLSNILFLISVFLLISYPYSVYAKNYHSEKKSSYHSVVREAIGPFKPVSNYIVRPGDSLYKIARKNHISVNCLIKYNDIGKSKLLRVKQRLHIPRWQQCIGK